MKKTSTKNAKFNTLEQLYSGKFSLRLPKSLHRDLAQLAKQDGSSLNQYVNSVLSRDAGGRLTAVRPA